MSEAPISEAEFEERADRVLRALDGALGEVDNAETDLESGILTVEFEDGFKYIINSHRAARQIWMAAELRAWHFDYLPARDAWIAAKSGDELWATVEGVLARKLGRPVSLRRSPG
jgi:CyaY protein